MHSLEVSEVGDLEHGHTDALFRSHELTSALRQKQKTLFMMHVEFGTLLFRGTPATQHYGFEQELAAVVQKFSWYPLVFSF